MISWLDWQGNIGQWHVGWRPVFVIVWRHPHSNSSHLNTSPFISAANVWHSGNLKCSKTAIQMMILHQVFSYITRSYLLLMYSCNGRSTCLLNIDDIAGDCNRIGHHCVLDRCKKRTLSTWRQPSYSASWPALHWDLLLLILSLMERSKVWWRATGICLTRLAQAINRTRVTYMQQHCSFLTVIWA